MRIQVIQHVAFEGPANIEAWALDRGHRLGRTRAYAGEPPPEPSGFDWLVVMGGPMGVNDEAEQPWLVAEKRAIEAALRAGRRILGVCLGAQLLASVLGARVYRAPAKEIGWFPVRTLPGAAKSAAFRGLPGSFAAFHWHGETFDLPAGAVHVAESDGCPNQAFEYGGRAVGLQYHMESTPESVRHLLEHCGGDIGGGPFEQPPGRLFARPEEFRDLEANLFGLLDRLSGPDGS